MARIDELLRVVDDETPLTDKNCVELELLSSLVEEYKKSPLENSGGFFSVAM